MMIVLDINLAKSIYDYISKDPFGEVAHIAVPLRVQIDAQEKAMSEVSEQNTATVPQDAPESTVTVDTPINPTV